MEGPQRAAVQGVVLTGFTVTELPVLKCSGLSVRRPHSQLPSEAPMTQPKIMYYHDGRHPHHLPPLLDVIVPENVGESYRLKMQAACAEFIGLTQESPCHLLAPLNSMVFSDRLLNAPTF